jgi:hypothetical protein
MVRLTLAPAPHTATGAPGERPWRLRAAAVHSWRAHREGMAGLAALPGEAAAVSVGRGAAGARAGADVLRVWDLATSTAGRRHTSVDRP